MSEMKEIWQQAVYSLDKHKALDLKALDVSRITPIADSFVLATGTSTTHLRSLADYVEEELGRTGVHPLRSEGYRSGDWITLDYGNVLLHLFRQEMREFYDLERLWSDAVPMDITPFLIESSNGEET